MGASKNCIMKIFFLTGISIGGVGTFLGTILGILFCYNIESIRQFLEKLTNYELFSAEIYFLTKMPALIDPIEVIQIIALALFLSFLASIYPPWFRCFNSLIFTTGPFNSLEFKCALLTKFIKFK